MRSCAGHACGDAARECVDLAQPTGLLLYTTNEGTLTVRETGVSKLAGAPSNGVLTSIQEVISGTGKYAGASGTLYNNAIDVNGVFTSDVRGELCLAPRKRKED